MRYNPKNIMQRAIIIIALSVLFPLTTFAFITGDSPVSLSKYELRTLPDEDGQIKEAKEITIDGPFTCECLTQNDEIVRLKEMRESVEKLSDAVKVCKDFEYNYIQRHTSANAYSVEAILRCVAVPSNN